MTGYIIRRLLYAIPTVLGVLLLTFVLFTVIGGDISGQLAGENASAETIKEIRHEYGFDKPLLFSFDSQFVNHVKGALTFNFGRALDGQPVIDKLKTGLGPSLALTVPMLFGVTVISVSLALVLAFVRGSAWDATANVICITAMSIPYLSFILFGQYFLSYKWGLFPVYFSCDLTMAQYVALPVIIGVAAGLGANTRFYRTVMLDEIHCDYVRTAFAKGLGAGGVLFKHVLRNAMLPVITRVLSAIPYLCLGSVLLEKFFGIPGLGYLVADAVAQRDYFVINAVTFIIALLFVVFNLITDICYAVADPRISFE